MNDSMNTNNHNSEPTREQVLLLDRATGDVAPEFDEWREPDEFELAAAEAAVAYAALALDTMPSHLRRKLQSTASQGNWNRSIAGKISRSEPGEVRMPPLPEARPASTWGASSMLGAAGWLLAAAAIAIAAVGWFRPTSPQPSTGEQLALLETAPGTVSANWVAWPSSLSIADTDPRDAANQVTGQFVWNEDRQQGYMVFENMPVNDPMLEQYQLWLVSTDHAHPIDGGVFDIASSGRVIVPIDPKIRATNIAALGITVEKPGGTVVSSQTDRLVAGLVP